jgi:hypothetical protein
MRLFLSYFSQITKILEREGKLHVSLSRVLRCDELFICARSLWSVLVVSKIIAE